MDSDFFSSSEYDYKKSHLNVPVNMIDAIRNIVMKWFKKNTIKNFDKLLILLEENDIYLSDIKYNLWSPVPDVIPRLVVARGQNNGSNESKGGICLWLRISILIF